MTTSRRAPAVLAGVALILITGLIHLVEAPEYFEEQAYVGVLFVLNFLGAAVVAVGLLRGSSWAWPLGLLVAGGAFVGFVLSRTSGLPGFREEEWEGVGLLALAVEAAFCLLALTRLSPRTSEAAGRRSAA